EIASTEPSQKEERLLAWLMEHDEIYRNHIQLPPDIRARERYFLGNTLRGMIEYVDGLSKEDQRKFLAAELIG
ncbi:MAG: MBL fold metallo-hydrolase, partial [Desulfuromonadaceae bacterium]|nr:MBL fold metallo-hydrolase [Desulfuromonadaceae bacterium]